MLLKTFKVLGKVACISDIGKMLQYNITTSLEVSKEFSF
jgi:hypothetical protein